MVCYAAVANGNLSRSKGISRTINLHPEVEKLMGSNPPLDPMFPKRAFMYVPLRFLPLAKMELHT